MASLTIPERNISFGSENQGCAIIPLCSNASNMERRSKCVAFILLYGSEAWFFARMMEIRFDGCFTRLLRKALNVSWHQKMCNKNLPRLVAKDGGFSMEDLPSLVTDTKSWENVFGFDLRLHMDNCHVLIPYAICFG